MLTSLLLLAASSSDGAYDFSSVKKVAAALELLDVAVDKHYGKDCTSKTPDSLSLIMGDYCYARAIILTAPLGEGVVSVLARAITDISEFFAGIDSSFKLKPSFEDGLLKRASLYRAAAYLGAYLSDASTGLIKELEDLGKLLGVFHIFFGKDKLEGKAAEKFLASIREKLNKLSNSYLEEEFRRLFSL